jgi:tetratricopeptide (TPR) repeat protein
MINIVHIAELETDYPGAIEYYKKAIETDPQVIHPPFCRAVLYDQPDIYNLGNLYTQLCDYESALNSLVVMIVAKNQFYEEIKMYYCSVSTALDA